MFEHAKGCPAICYLLLWLAINTRDNEDCQASKKKKEPNNIINIRGWQAMMMIGD